MSSAARRNPICPRCLDPISYNKVRRAGGYEAKRVFHPECWKDERREREQNAILAFWVFSPKSEVEYDNAQDSESSLGSEEGEPGEDPMHRGKPAVAGS